MPLTTRRLAALIFFIGLFAMAARVAVDSDTFWHLRAGTWMLDNGRLLNFDVFSHTRAGAEWINHSWLSEIPMALLYRLFGFGGLNLATALIVWLTFFVVYHSGSGGSYLRAFIIVLAATASAVYWSARPQIVSMLLTAVFGYILIQFRQHEVNRLWLLPLLMLLWVNLHGGFAIGFILLGVTFVGELIHWVMARAAPWGRADTQVWATTQVRATTQGRPYWLGATGALCVIAVLFNPYGPQMLLYPFRTISIGVLQNYIQEWQSPNFHAREAQVFILLWVLTFGAVGVSRLRLSATDFLLFAIFSALALLAARNIAVFAVVAAPILMRHADAALAELQARFPKLKIAGSETTPPRRWRILNWILLGVVVAAAAVKIALPLNPATTLSAIAATSPVGAANYLKQSPTSGPMFNSYNFGGYLAWALYPDLPVYVDGRTDLYDDEFLTEYLNVYTIGPGWEKTLAERGIKVVVTETASPLARALLMTPGWSARYSDPLAIVFVKP
jgi:hypothetical protein